MTQLNTTKRGFWRNRSGSAMIEFALGSPVMIAMGMYGLEFANIAIVNRQISQTTMSMADNISRVGPADGNAGITTVDESDVNDTLSGGKVETGGTINADGSITGGGMNITGNGRIIISSLEVNSTNHQFIHWQRCKGALSSRPDSSAADQWGGSNIASSGSSYGVQGDDKGLTGNAASGMGPSSSRTQAIANSTSTTNNGVTTTTYFTGTAVMYVEVWYKYQPMFPSLWASPIMDSGYFSAAVRSFKLQPSLKELHYTAAYLARDQRNYTINSTTNSNDAAGITDLPAPVSGVVPAKSQCNVFSA